MYDMDIVASGMTQWLGWLKDIFALWSGSLMSSRRRQSWIMFRHKSGLWVRLTGMRGPREA
jgi:hypothetical protein